MAKKSTKQAKKASKKEAIKILTERLVDLLDGLGYETTSSEKSIKKIAKKLVSELPIKSPKADKLAKIATEVTDDASKGVLNKNKGEDNIKTPDTETSNETQNSELTHIDKKEKTPQDKQAIKPKPKRKGTEE